MANFTNVLRCLVLFSGFAVCLSSCDMFGEDDDNEGESASVSGPLDYPPCDPDQSWSEHDLPLGASCSNFEKCNECQSGAVCLEGGSGDYYDGSAHNFTMTDFFICTHSCSSDSDCTNVSMASANGWVGTETRYCNTFAEGQYCASDITSEGGESCGEPCPDGCCSTTGLTCCQPPFCSGDCAYSPCCS